MASQSFRLTAYSARADTDPGEVLAGLGAAEPATGAFGGFRVAAAEIRSPSGEDLAARLREAAATDLGWAWRAADGANRPLRAVVMGQGLDAAALHHLAGEIHSRGPLVTGLRVLSDTFPAVELTLAGPAADPEALTRDLQGPAEANAVDLAVLAPTTEAFGYRLLMMDMDSTLLAVECIDEIAEHAGVKEQVAAITERAMNGELDFKGSLVERVGMLASLPEGVLEEVYRERIRTNPGAERLLAAARGMGMRVAVVSGGFTFFTERLERDLGIDFTNANVLEVADGRLTGRVLGDIVDGAVKAATLRELRDRLGLTRDQLVAMGDGANDLAMIAEAGLGIAYHAKPRVRAQAPYNLFHSPLDGLLYLLGLTDADIEGYCRDSAAG
ncbi:MAG TPA: phosphoserine phosphatase SerB [Gammaproteobacteria bacterium]|nr:phosphoserine phosphatase SerB [Gammaproteobacteria bacterium]